MALQSARFPLFLAGTLVLGACNGSGISSAGAVPQVQMTRSDAQHRSWALPQAKSEDLLYLGGDPASGDVSMYTFPRGKLVGVLSGFSAPSGICSDRDGNIWITNYQSGGPIVEYAHGGTQPIATLQTPKKLMPQDCSVDPTSGDLAVVGYESGGPQRLAIYDSSGAWKIYRVPSVFETTSFCGYDGSGNLFFDGYSTDGDTAYNGLGELRNGAKSINVVNFSPKNPSFPSYYPTAIGWDGTYLAVGAIYGISRYALRKNVAVLKGQVTFEKTGTIIDDWIQGGKVVAVTGYPNFGSGPLVQIFKYPAGGYPIDGITVSSAFGVTVSVARHRP
jgi:hypothetical protein